MNQADLQGIHTIQRALHNHRDGLRGSRLLQRSKAKEDCVVCQSHGDQWHHSQI
jgi:hypothetical protein